MALRALRALRVTGTSARRTRVPALVAVIGLLGACGDGNGTTPSSSTSTTTSTTTIAPVETVIAVWPSSAAGFPTPRAAAADFVTRVLGVNPRLGSYMAGDSRSGEMDVYIGEDLPSVPDVTKGTLILRNIDGRGWFVMAAANSFNTIDSPEDRARVRAAPLEVRGRARGFEGQVSVTAYLPAGATGSGEPIVIDSTSVIAGSMETPEPFSVTLDLGEAEPGSVVAVLVRGGRGLEQDPGEFTVIPLVVDEAD